MSLWAKYIDGQPMFEKLSRCLLILLGAAGADLRSIFKLLRIGSNWFDLGQGVKW